MIPYQFSILRYLHNFSLGEFVNVGVIMWLPQEQSMQFLINKRYSRISGFFSNFDGRKYYEMIRVIDSRCKEAKKKINNDGFQDSLFPLANDVDYGDGFDKLKAALVREDASCFQWSHTMVGIVKNPAQRLEELFHEFVTCHEKKQKRDRYSESDIWSVVESVLIQRGLFDEIETNVEIVGEEFSYKFRTGWYNGIRQVLEPISFDYLDNESIINKAHTWMGRLMDLSNNKFKMTGIVAPPNQANLHEAYQGAIRILEKAPNIRAIVEEDKFEQFANEIESDLGLDKKSSKSPLLS